ncbi:MAG: RNA 2',3'-cyclic phosphodiesterase [Bacteroidetes bacterium]|nr:RNA 2',3'-cyclic phosphodiesterase [Bacteroidota bacterium]
MKKRLFIAIPLPNNIKETLMEAAQTIENESPPCLPQCWPDVRWTSSSPKGGKKIKWVPKQNLHITLLFLGKKDENELSEIISKIENVTKQCTAFSLNLVGILTIIKKRKPVMIWAEFDRNKHFTNLVTKCSQVLEIQPDHDPRPHITLARIKYGKSRGKSVSNPAFESNSLESFKLEVMTIHLWESVLTSKQAVYKSVKSFKLI